MATLVLQPDSTTGKDTNINDTYPTANFGSDTNFNFGDDTTDASTTRGLIQFDLSDIPSDSTINSATLTLYLSADGDFRSTNNRTARVYRMVRSWEENETTWNISETGTNWGTSGASNTSTDRESTDIGTLTFNTTDSQYDAKSFTLTASKIEEMIPDGSFTNKGFLIKMDTETDDRYFVCSCEFATESYRPKLTIDYTPPFVDYTRDLSDSLGITDSVLSYYGFSRLIADTVALTDTNTRVADSSRDINQDTVGLTDSVIKSSGYSVFITQDTIGITDLVFNIKVQCICVFDSVGISDSLVRLAAFSKKITDTVNLTDIISRQIVYSRDITDNVGLTDTLSGLSVTFFTRDLSDTVGLTDSITFEAVSTLVLDPIIEFYQVEGIIPEISGIDENIPPMYDVIDG